jgi:uncharacterized membrane protein YGL010W
MTHADRLFADYADHHQTPGNQRCHLLGIPLIAAGLLGLLAIEVLRVGGWPIEASALVVVALMPFYLRLDAKLGVALTILYVVLYLGTRLLTWQINLGLFLAGWVFQFIGHGKYERKSPAFFTNLSHLFIGPLWVVNHVLHLRPESRAEESAEGAR